MGLRRYQPIGVPIVLARSAVAVPHTGDTDETVLATVTIPAGAMGLNGIIVFNALFSNNNSGNNKISRVRFSGISGTVYSSTTQTTSLSNRHVSGRIANRNAANSQVGHSNSTNFVAAVAAATSTADTTAATTLVFTGQLANAADTITLESYSVELVRGD